MYVGSSSYSIYRLLYSSSRTQALAGRDHGAPAPLARSVGGSSSDDTRVAAFQARLAQSSFERSDTNRDGFVVRDEYITNNMKPRHDGYEPKLEDVQRTWNQIDKAGKGRLSREEYAEGFSSVLKVSLGHFDKPLR